MIQALIKRAENAEKRADSVENSAKENMQLAQQNVQLAKESAQLAKEKGEVQEKLLNQSLGLLQDQLALLKIRLWIEQAMDTWWAKHYKTAMPSLTKTLEAFWADKYFGACMKKFRSPKQKNSLLPVFMELISLSHHEVIETLDLSAKALPVQQMKCVIECISKHPAQPFRGLIFRK